MMHRQVFIFLILMSFWVTLDGNILRTLIQNNIAGPTLNLETVSWPFDPDAGLRRRVEYEAVNGRYGSQSVEKVGLGEDGRTEERKKLQQYRDSIGGLSYKVPD